jgi:hypothetical protein
MTRSGLVPFQHAGYFRLTDAVDSANGTADFSGHTLGLFFRVQIEFHF